MFKKFHGVRENPTEVLVGTIEEYVRKHRGVPTGTLLGSCTMLETTGEGALGPLMELFHSSSLSYIHEMQSTFTCACSRTEMRWKLASPKQKVLEPHRMTRE
jgi:redox-regulated HSP33 family molecular chaperone